MKSIQEIYATMKEEYQGQPFQMLVKFSNNPDRIVCEADLEPNSKFVRASKRLLGESFEDDGFIVGGEIVRGDVDAADVDGYAFRTWTKGKHNQYLLYVSSNFQYVENIRKKSYSSLKKESDASRQLSVNDVTDPNPDRVVSIIGTGYGREYGFRMRSHMFHEDYVSKAYQNDTGLDYVAQYMGVVLGLKTVLNNADQIDVVKIYADTSKKYGSGVYKLPLKKWIPYNRHCRAYVDEMFALKEKLAEKGVSICFTVRKG